MKVILGTANFSKIYSIKQKKIKKKNQIIKQIKYAIKKGINIFDTAPSYGLSENLLGKTNNKFKVITKISKINPKNIKKTMNLSILNSLKNLNKNYVDCLIIHDVDFFKKFGV